MCTFNYQRIIYTPNYFRFGKIRLMRFMLKIYNHGGSDKTVIAVHNV